MPEDTQNENMSVDTPAVVEETPTEVVETEPTKKPFYKSFKFWLYLVFVLLLVVLILWLTNVFMVYRQASVYKKTYDAVQDEKAFCQGIQGTSQSKEVFDYCDRFEAKFNSLETTK